MKNKAERQAARAQALANEFTQAISDLDHPNGVTLLDIGRQMRATPPLASETYLGRSSVTGKLLMQVGVKIGLVNLSGDLLPPVRDQLEQAGHIETALEAACLQRDGHPQYRLHYLINTEPVLG